MFNNANQFSNLNSQAGKITSYILILLASVSTICSIIILITILNLPFRYRTTVYLYRGFIVLNNIFYSTVISTFYVYNLLNTNKFNLETDNLKQLIYEDKIIDFLDFEKSETKFANNTVFLNFFGVSMMIFYFSSHCSLFFSLSNRIWAILFPNCHKKIGKKVTVGVIFLTVLFSFLLSVLPIFIEGYNLTYDLIRNVFVFVRGIKSLSFLIITFLTPSILLILMYLIYMFIFIKYCKYMPDTRSNPVSSNNHEKKVFKALNYLVWVFIINTLPTFILVFLSNYLDINKNKNFVLIPTKNFYMLIDSLIVTNIFLTICKINFDNFLFYSGDKEVKKTFKNLSENFKCKYFKMCNRRNSNPVTIGLRDLPFNHQIAPIFLENNVNRPRTFNETEL